MDHGRKERKRTRAAKESVFLAQMDRISAVHETEPEASLKRPCLRGEDDSKEKKKPAGTTLPRTALLDVSNRGAVQVAPADAIVDPASDKNELGKNQPASYNAQVADPTVKMAPVEVLPLKHPIEYSFGDLAEVALEKPALGSLLPHPPTQLRPLASPASAGTGKTTLEASRSSGNRPSAVEVNRLVLSKPAWGAKGLSLARPTHQGSGSLGGGLRCFSVRAAPARVAPSRAASAPGVLPGGHLLQKAVTSLDGAAPRSSPSVNDTDMAWVPEDGEEVNYLPILIIEGSSDGAATGVAHVGHPAAPDAAVIRDNYRLDDNREYERAGGDLYGVPLLDELDESSATNAKAVVRCDLLAAFDSADGGGALPTVAEFRRAITAAAVERALASLATPAPGPVDEILPFGEFPQLAPAPLAPAAGAGDALLGLAAAGGLSDENAALVAGGIFATSFGGVGAGVVDLDLPDLGDLGDLPDFL